MTVTEQAKKELLEAWNATTEKVDEEMREKLMYAKSDYRTEEANVRAYYLELHATVNIAFSKALEWLSAEIAMGR